MVTFKGVDYYEIDNLLSEEEKFTRDNLRKFIDNKVIPIIENHFWEGTLPKELIPELGELGVFGANLKGYGCAGVNSISYGLITQELERGDSGLRSLVTVQGSLSMYPIYAFGSEEQKEKWLPQMATGEKIGCFGLTEPDFGSNPAGMQTKAKKDGKYYIINGTKMWITNGTLADIAVVWAKTDQGIRGFLVEKGTEGFSANDIKGKFSLKASITSELVFEDCKIPEENILPGTTGLKSPLMCLNQARYGIAWGCVGAAMACYETALDYAKNRIQFDRPIAGFQLVQEKLVYMLTEITKAQLLCYQLGRLKDQGKATHAQISLAKRNNAFHALEIARMSRDILGANGITNEYPIIRHLLNLESVKTYEGTHDIHNLILGQDITGLSAFS